jgi:RNA polymerase sigma-70 factor (ECF subfamily)
MVKYENLQTREVFLSSRHDELLELLDKSGAELFALLTRLTLRQDVAEELMQELFIKLSHSRGPSKAANWDAYARKAAVNLAFDWRRCRKRAEPRLEQVREQALDGESPLGKLIHSEELAETLNAIERLNKVSRQVLVMRYIEQKSYDDIAGDLGKSPHHVRALCSRALSRLRNILGCNHRKLSQKEM